MQYLVGALITVCFFICLGISFYIGYRCRPKPKKQPIDEKAKLQAEQMQKDFKSIMNYNIEVAMKGR